MIENYFFFYGGEILAKVLDILFLFAPIWLPYILFRIFYDLWLIYIRADFIKKKGNVLLEIKLPKEIMKSPAAMELFITSVYQGGAVDGLHDTFWHGKVRPWFSLEMVSLGGEVHFYIWCWKNFRNLVEAQIYAQYPNVEIYEAHDYALDFDYDPEEHIIWGTQFKKSYKGKSGGPVDAVPIKTYVDYGLDKDPKEEFKIDPMTSVLEYLGSLGKGEQAWIQILIQCHRENDFKNDGVFKKTEDWKAAAKKEIEKLMKLDEMEKAKKNKQEMMPLSGEFAMSAGERDLVKAIERNVAKFPFETAIRGFYISDLEHFNAIGITGLIGSVRQYSSNTLAALKLDKYTDVAYHWLQDFRGMRVNWYKRRMLKAYKLRSMFQYPFKNYRGKPFIMSTEELATIYHFPGEAVSTPTFGRIPSKKSEAPGNLPV